MTKSCEKVTFIMITIAVKTSENFENFRHVNGHISLTEISNPSGCQTFPHTGMKSHLRTNPYEKASFNNKHFLPCLAWKHSWVLSLSTKLQISKY